MHLWNDRTPAHRCDWVDLLRGWAMLVMMEVHCVNTWLDLKLRPEWLNYLNGLVAPSFLMCAGFSLVLSTFRTDGTLRPFSDTWKRLGFILICAYALHSPGITLAEWTVLSTAQKFRELFKIDVLQCIVFSLLLLQGLARLIRNPRLFGLLALGLAVAVPLLSPYLWAQGVGDGFWLPVRGLLNGNPDRGVQALFPLFPWLAFPAFGAALGAAYRAMRVERGEERAQWSEAQWLLAMGLAGLALHFLGARAAQALWDGGRWVQHPVTKVWLFNGIWTWSELQALHNTTLASVADRLGWILAGGAAFGTLKLVGIGRRLNGIVEAASKESLLVYMLHLQILYGILMTTPVMALTGWDWNAQGWGVALSLTAAVVALNVWAALAWQKIRKEPLRMRSLQRVGLSVLAVWFLAGGWWSFRYLLQSPELAREPYPFLNAARLRKGLPPTPDGLSRDPDEYFREAEARGIRLNEEARKKMAAQILQRGK